MRIRIDPEYIAELVKATGVINPKFVVIREGYLYVGSVSPSEAEPVLNGGHKTETLPAVEKPPVYLSGVFEVGGQLFPTPPVLFGKKWPPYPLKYKNPKWSKETKAALEWLWTFKKVTGKPASFPKLAKAIGMNVVQLRRYYDPDPPNPNQDTVNAIWKLRNALEGK